MISIYLLLDCGSCSEEIVKTVARHSKFYYIRANRCQSIYNDIFALRGWKCVEINGIEYELNSILVEKWKGMLAHYPKTEAPWRRARYLGG